MVRERLVRLLGLAAALAGAVWLGSALPAAPFELAAHRPAGSAVATEVDFSLPLATGLASRVQEHGTYELTGTVTSDNEAPRNIKHDVDATMTLRQKVVAVTDGKVTRLTRTYETYRIGNQLEQEDSKKPRQWTRTHPLSGRRFRATWSASGLALEEALKDGWKSAGPRVRKHLSTRKLLHPVLPMPAGRKQVDDTWTLSTSELHDYFSDPFEERWKETTVTGTGRMTLKGFEVRGTDRCAVIDVSFDVKATMPDHPGFHLTMQGHCHYSLRHRIVVAFAAKGSMRTKGRMKHDDTSFDIDFTSTIKTEATVKILDAGSAPLAGEIPRDGR